MHCLTLLCETRYECATCFSGTLNEHRPRSVVILNGGGNTHHSNHQPQLILITMSVDLMLAALRRGKDGNEILSILDAVTGGDDNAATETVSAQPTLDPIDF